MKEATGNLDRPSEAMEDFSVPGYYKDAEGHRIMMGRLGRDAWTAYSCAIAYQVTSGAARNKFADKAVRTLSSWSSINRKTSNHDGDLAMADAGSGLLFAAELLSDYGGWTDGQRMEFRSWLENVYLESCSKISVRPNNWGDWGNLGCIASHYFLDDAGGIDADIERIRNRIGEAIAPDGSMPHETCRGNNGIWYTYFALAPLTSASQIALNSRGVDLFHYKCEAGYGIEHALDYLLKYSREPGTWPHYIGKDLNIPRPGKWPGNLFEAMSGIYGRKDYEDWIIEARPIMYFGHHYTWSTPTLLRTVGS